MLRRLLESLRNHRDYLYAGEVQVKPQSVIQAIEPTRGELVSCMRSAPLPYMTVTHLISQYQSRVTRKPRFVVGVTSDDGKQSVVGMMVIRDCLGYLHEVPSPVCNTCEGITECECVEV